MQSQALRSMIVAALLFAASTVLHAQQGGMPGQNGGNGVGLNLGSAGYTDHAHVDHNRRVQGTVLNADGKHIPNAIVFIKNLKSKSTQSMVSDDQGAFRFGALDKSADYQLWAQADKKTGVAKTLSQYDTRDELTLNLKIE